jgi:adenine-specific DNA-methyltransferase
VARKSESKGAPDAPPAPVESTDTPEVETGQGTALSWFGRRQARVSIPRPRILEPDPKHSDPTDEDPGNLLIEGDNRQAMVSLLPQYAGKVDVVLIDPPYNTGKKDFRYSDARFKDPDADTRDGDFVSAEDGGRHAKWLNQMAPTLRIIRDLMAPHGVIFIHINDIELPRLLLLMEEIFDEKNRIGIAIWEGAAANLGSRIGVQHEYVVVWAKDLSASPSGWSGFISGTRQTMLDRFEELKKENPTDESVDRAWTKWVKDHKDELGGLAPYGRADLGGPYTSVSLHQPSGKGLRYDVLHPVTKKPCRLPAAGLNCKPETMANYIANGEVLFGKDENTVIRRKQYLHSSGDQMKSILPTIRSEQGSDDIAALFDGSREEFPNPKPVALEEFLLSFVAGKDAIVLDAFAGSGTTGHAVMRLNSRDKGTRRFILLEEGVEGDPYSITLTSRRLRAAREKEGIPGGFSFLRVGEAINFDAFEKLQREHLIQSILQTDASGRGGGIKPVKGAKWVIGHNARREAICLHYDAKKHTPITAAILKEIYAEVDKLGLNRPLRVYGESSEIFRSESFIFFKLPDEVANNLTVSLKGSR